MTACRFIDKAEPRRLNGRHLDDCVDPDCRGCQPCTENHCLLQWYGDRGDCETHAVSVCPSCVATVRAHLVEIVRLCGYPLLEEVLSEGDDATEAADLLGPVASPDAWRQRGRHGHKYEPDSRLGEQHPLWVLGRFDLIVTEHLGHARRTQRITINGAADYLYRNLAYLAADIEFDFRDLATDLEACRSHLEQVLHDGEQRETGAPCMDCHDPLLRVYAGDDLPWRHRDGSKPRAGMDSWACRRCRTWRSDAEYRLNVADAHRREAEWLTAADMIERTNVSRGSLTGWASKGEVRKRTAGGRVVYRVEDVKRLMGPTDDAA